MRQCIDSAINQSYTNLEIILVDDGSPDKCPQICDEYAKKDNRVVVVHKKNGGLSDARNAGLDIAKGLYIYFLDRDDFLGKETISCLYSHIKKNDNIAIAIGYFTAVFENRYKPFKKEWEFNKPRYIEANDFANRMLMEKSNFAATAKLYRKELFEELRFQNNVKNEDSLFTADLIPIIESNSYCCIEIPIYSYYYRQHIQSICHNDKDPLEWHIINNYNSIIKKYNDRTILVKYLKKQQFDLTINLQLKLIKNADSALYLENYQRIRNISLATALKRKNIKKFLYFVILKYMPHIIKR